jgi:hypothetical protein
MKRKRDSKSAAKPGPTLASAARKPHELHLRKRKPGETPAQALAGVVVAGLAGNANVARAWSIPPLNEEADLTAVLENIVAAGERVSRGDLSHAEAVLMAQGVALNSVFTTLACRANKSEYMDNLERYLRLALKAQSQCRATFETLALLKNPPVFTRQANIAAQQVVNNGTITQPSRAGNLETRQNELLEAPHGERLEPGAASTAGTGDTTLASVGRLDRPTNGRG